MGPPDPMTSCLPRAGAAPLSVKSNAPCRRWPGTSAKPPSLPVKASVEPPGPGMNCQASSWPPPRRSMLLPVCRSTVGAVRLMFFAGGVASELPLPPTCCGENHFPLADCP